MAGQDQTQKQPPQTNSDQPQPENRHDACPIWQDTPCCCEPEPRWQAVADENERDEEL
jgi:hypothetical protein